MNPVREEVPMLYLKVLSAAGAAALTAVAAYFVSYNRYAPAVGFLVYFLLLIPIFKDDRIARLRKSQE